MKSLKQLFPRIVACFATSFVVLGAQAAPDAASDARAKAFAQNLATEIASFCPLADANGTGAFDKCRMALAGDSGLRRALPDYILWGRQKDPKKLHKESNLTQFNPDVFASMYLSLFMFNGKHTVAFDEREGSYQIRLQAAFRNRLSPGEYPYPFWHEDDKWSMYENAKEILLWWDGDKNRLKVAQFTIHSNLAPLVAVNPRTHDKFDGQWLWTDTAGVTQPKVTVFDGIFRADNPYIGKLDGAYKTLALTMRDGQCNKCHVPNNPDHMKKLVLLQTPMHAAAEIKRILKTVREDTMPRDEFGIEQPLEKAAKAALLKEGAAFDSLVDAAKKWEADQKAQANQKAPAGQKVASNK
jgi:hypothetical protein